MARTLNLALIPGDGIGTEVVAEGTGEVELRRAGSLFFGDKMTYPWGTYGNQDQAGSRASGVDYDNSWPYSNAAGSHTHAFSTDGAGAHAHNVSMNGAGNHTHTISVAQVGDHGHTASAADAGAHTHAVTVNNTGGDRNLPAGLRMIYCITY